MTVDLDWENLGFNYRKLPFRKKPLFPKVYKDFIFQTMVECQTGQDLLAA